MVQRGRYFHELLVKLEKFRAVMIHKLVVIMVDESLNLLPVNSGLGRKFCLVIVEIEIRFEVGW